jgi:hypothetical protein
MNRLCLISLTTLGLVPTIIKSQDSITIIKQKVLQTLQAKRPTAINEFLRLCNQYDACVELFFDMNNKDTLATHITYLKKELSTFEKTIKEAQFNSVLFLLNPLHADLKNLVNTLQQYVGSKRSIPFLFAMRNYVFLVPEPLRSQGIVYLIKCLRHRFHCI